MAGVRLSTQTIHGMGDGCELGSLECSTDGTVDIDGIFEGLLLGAWLVLVDRLELGTNVGNGLGF